MISATDEIPVLLTADSERLVCSLPLDLFPNRHSSRLNPTDTKNLQEAQGIEVCYTRLVQSDGEREHN